MRRVVIAFLMVVVMSAMAAPPCLACLCALPSDESEHAKRADVVFTGRLKKVEELSGDKGHKMRFLVGKVYKGQAKRFTNVFSSEGPCGETYLKREGSKYTVFADLDAGKKYTNGGCDGTKKGSINPDNYDLGEPYAPRSDS
jgi:hypothetical protein